MKTLYSLAAFVLFISASLSFTSKINVKENTLTATFKGLTIDDYFKFEDDNNKIFLFYDIKEDIDLIEELTRIKGYDKIPLINPEKENIKDTLNYKQKLFFNLGK